MYSKIPFIQILSTQIVVYILPKGINTYRKNLKHELESNVATQG